MDLEEILKKHKMWLNDEEGGERANLSGFDLSYTDLFGADLRMADLRRANLSYTDLREADLRVVDLRWTDLIGADLRWANLKGVDLRLANLSGADLREADLRCADLNGVDLREASINWPIECPEKGSFIGFKKARTEISDYIVELEIQTDSERCSATSRKCRCSKAKVISITNLDGSQADIKEVASTYDKTFKYRIGEIVEVANFDPNRWNECSTGIHFFITRQEAVDY